MAISSYYLFQTMLIFLSVTILEAANCRDLIILILALIFASVDPHLLRKFMFLKPLYDCNYPSQQ